MSQPRVGIGIIIIKDNTILLGKRKNIHGDGCWSIPGGHLEFGETFKQCARREALEETGLEITNIVQGPTTNDIFVPENKHYVSIFMIGQYQSGEPQIMEPEKNEMWGWFTFDALPSPLFLPVQNLLKLGFNPFIYYKKNSESLAFSSKNI